MRPQRKKIAALVGAAALAAPATAAAQGSVDEQYRDPFAGQGDEGSQNAQPAPSDDASAPSSSDSPAVTPAPAAAAPEQLPRTGIPAAPIAAAAIALVAAGTTLRRRLA